MNRCGAAGTIAASDLAPTLLAPSTFDVELDVGGARSSAPTSDVERDGLESAGQAVPISGAPQGSARPFVDRSRREVEPGMLDLTALAPSKLAPSKVEG